MTPRQLADYLQRLVQRELSLSLMIWGGPGVGKSSIVRQTADAHDLSFVDLRLSQLAPTDLRGLPVAKDGVSTWYPPEFLPTEGRGILLLDELNMAPPALQGVAQQLVLDRAVGRYRVPEGWFIWAAGNRKEDRAAVFDMPTPLANRFIHLEVEPDFESFKTHALRQGFHEAVVAFLAFRPSLLYQLDPIGGAPAWPSPRSWEHASLLHGADLDIHPAVGATAAAEFRSFLASCADLPDLGAVLRGEDAPWPEAPLHRYAVTIGLASRAKGASEVEAARRWLARVAGAEWQRAFDADVDR